MADAGPGGGVPGGAAFRTAARFVDQHALGLRATDALHVATASAHGATVHTLDQLLATAGPALSVPTSAADMIEALPRSWR